MCWFAEEDLAVDMAAPSLARRFVAARLRQALGVESDLEGLVDDAELVVSELVTNAVNADARTIAVQVSIRPHRVRLAVIDDAAGGPSVQTPSPHGTGGRGLGIIEQLAQQWGSLPMPEGKQVWADLPVDSTTTAAVKCMI